MPLCMGPFKPTSDHNNAAEASYQWRKGGDDDKLYKANYCDTNNMHACVCEAEGGKRRRITGLILVIRAPSICLSMQVFSTCTIRVALVLYKMAIIFKGLCTESSHFF